MQNINIENDRFWFILMISGLALDRELIFTQFGAHTRHPSGEPSVHPPPASNLWGKTRLWIMGRRLPP
jgi:hypothetical protein